MHTIQTICSELTTDKIRDIAYESKFVKRIRTILPETFLSVLCECSINDTLSFNDFASTASIEYDMDATRQAYFYKITNAAVDFIKKILEFVLELKFNLYKDISNNKYKRILIQDSTVIKLPQQLYNIFSGVSNGHKAVCNARIQCVYDLMAGEFIKFAIDPYSENDLKVTHDIDVEAGDLLLRDRGYFTAAVLEEKRTEGAEQIFRYKHKTVLYDAESKEAVNLLELLEKNQTIDKTFCIGENRDIKVRVLATPVPEEVANLRRMNTKKAARNHKCSDDLLKLLNWSIFLTTIEDTSYTIRDIYALYSLRWRIENIFKTWKSELNFSNLHNVSEVQLKTLLYARFIMITLLHRCYYVPLTGIIRKDFNKELSMFKLLRYISRNLKQFVLQYTDKKTKQKIIERVVRYCTHDLRKRRTFNQLLDNILQEVGS